MNENSADESCKSSKCITCPHCGEQIPMMPVLSDMIKAIEDHLTSHNEHSTPKHGHIQRPRASFLSENLAEQVLVRAAEIGGTLSREPTIALPDTDTET